MFHDRVPRSLRDLLFLLALSSAANLGAQWSLIQTRPTPIGLNAVRFFDDQTGIAVGLAGTVIRTTDAGVTWTVVSSGTTKALKRISILDDQTAVVCGDYSTVIRTTDQGLTWSSVSVPLPVTTYSDMSFPTPLVGYIGAHSNSTNVLLKSLDGGISWSYVPLDVANNINSLYFLTELDGFAGMNNGKLMRTLDGGVSWTEMFDDIYDIDLIYFVNPSKGFISTSSGGMRQTANGGMNWGAADGGAVRSMWCSAGSNIIFKGQGYGNISIADTNAFGWYTVFTLLDPFSIQGICSPSDSVVIAVGDYGLIYRSTNNGGVWTKIQTGYPYTIRDVHFQGDSLAFSCGDRGTILKTTDAFWNESRKNDLANVVLNRIKFPFPDTGFACGTGRRILRSFNGGTSWPSALPPITFGSPIMDIEFANNGEGYACARDEELILHTPDRGTTWDTAHIVSNAVQDLNDLHIVNDSTFLLAGTAGLLMRSTDAGATFVPCTVIGGNPNANMLEFDFPTSSVGYVRTGNSVLLRTIDAGITWTQTPFPLNYVNDMRFLSETTGYLLAEDRLFWTDDGGGTLASQTIPPGFQMLQLHVNSNGLVYLFGIGGSILTNDSAVVALGVGPPMDLPARGPLAIFPNPSSTQFTIAFSGEQTADTGDLTITDVSGRVVFVSKVALQPRITLNPQSLKSGVYIVELVNGANRSCTRMIRSESAE